MTPEEMGEPNTPLSGVQKFDLRGIAEEQYRSNRGGRWFFLGMTVAFTVFFFVVLPSDLNVVHLALTGGLSIHDRLRDAVVVGGVAFFGFISTSGLLMTRYGPVSLVLDPIAARFRYRNGHEVAYRWKSRWFRLDLYDVRGAPDWIASFKPRNLIWISTGLLGLQSPLSDAAFDALRDSAQSHGLQVSLVQLTFLRLLLVNGMLPREARVYRIRGARTSR